MNDIVPAILPSTLDELSMKLGILRGTTKWVQIDVCDGMFVPTRTWPMNPSDRVHFSHLVRGDTELPHGRDFVFEVDLMVQDPEKHLMSWIAMGVARAVVHLESRHDWTAVKEVVGGSLELGLAVDLTPTYEKLSAYVPCVDYLQVMGIPMLGAQGTMLDERVYPLVKRIRADFPDVTIQIDGGVTLQNAGRLLDAGADRLVVGSKIVHAEDPKKALRDFQNLAQTHASPH